KEAQPFKKDAESYLQAQISAQVGGAPAFRARSTTQLPIDDADINSYRLIYRDVRSYAVGHGTSVRWTTTPDGGRATLVATASVPRQELLLADSNADIPTADLTMHGM